MMKTNGRLTGSLLFVVVFAALLATSCAKKPGGDSIANDCLFIQDDNTDDGYISDTEREIMNECYAERLSNTLEIRNNLIGEWKIIGHGEGWFPRVSQPCGYLTIDESQIIFEFTSNSVDTLSIHFWSLEAIESSSQVVLHRIRTTPNLTPRMGLTTFCDQYMFGDATPFDGNMYLFEKVK